MSETKRFSWLILAWYWYHFDSRTHQHLEVSFCSLWFTKHIHDKSIEITFSPNWDPEESTTLKTPIKSPDESKLSPFWRERRCRRRQKKSLTEDRGQIKPTIKVFQSFILFWLKVSLGRPPSSDNQSCCQGPQTRWSLRWKGESTQSRNLPRPEVSRGTSPRRGQGSRPGLPPLPEKKQDPKKSSPGCIHHNCWSKDWDRIGIKLGIKSLLVVGQVFYAFFLMSRPGMEIHKSASLYKYCHSYHPFSQVITHQSHVQICFDLWINLF